MKGQLRYTLQVRNGLRWHTARTWRPGDQEFRVLERMVFLGANEWGKPVRLLLMPFNILAVASY